jgi:lactate racemase
MTKNVPSIKLDYGRDGLDLAIDPAIADWTIIEPHEVPSATSFSQCFIDSVSAPIGAADLKEIISPDDMVVIVTSDNTRPLPNHLLIPAIVDYCRLDPSNVTILIGTGSHRPLDSKTLIDFLGEKIVNNFEIVCHDAADLSSLKKLGITKSGIPVSISRYYLEASKKIIIGFIEPHLFAGFSGGAKAVCPGVCGIDTIDAFHSFEIIGHPDSDYGILDNNPQQQAAREVVAMAPPDFMINVILNSQKEITNIFSGDYIEAHRIGCGEMAGAAMIKLDHKFPIVITTNSGYPLDQNLYQSVKGMAAAALIVEEGGTIIIASECINGIPDDGNFAEILNSQPDIDSLMTMLADKEYTKMDRWQAQKLGMVLKKADVLVFSSLDSDAIKKCKMTKIENIRSAILSKINQLGYKPKIAVLPHGPLTIPFVK